MRRSDQYLCAAIQLKSIQPGRTNPALPGNQRRRKERVGTMQVSGFVRRLDQLLHCSVDRAASSAMWVPVGTRVWYGMLRFTHTECSANSGPKRNSWRAVDARGSLPGCQAGDSFNCTLAYSIHHLLHVFVFLRVSTNTSHLSLYQFTIFLVDSFCKLIFPPFLKIHFSAHF